MCQLAQAQNGTRERLLEFRPIEKVRRGEIGGLGMLALQLLQTLPQALGCGADIFRLVENHDRLASQGQQGVLARILRCRGELPAGKDVAVARLLEQRQNLGLGNLQNRPLGFHIETADGFDFVAEEFDAQRAWRFRRRTRPESRPGWNTRRPSPPDRDAHSQSTADAPRWSRAAILRRCESPAPGAGNTRHRACAAAPMRPGRW